MRGTRISIAAAAWIALLGGWAFAQPPREGERPPPPPERERGEGSDETLRDRLESMIRFAERIIEKNSQALEELDKGADPREVMKALQTPEFSRARVTMSPLTRRDITPERLDPETMERVRSYIRENIPQIEEPLASIEQIGPEGARRLLAKMTPRIVEIMELEHDDPEQASLRLAELKSGLEILDRSRAYRRALSDDAIDAEPIKRELRAAIERRFDAQVGLKQLEIERLRVRVDELSDALEDLESSRDEQIERQIESSERLTSGTGERRGRRSAND